MANELLGQLNIDRTVYAVYRLPVGANTAKAGVQGHFALEGPQGACYFVTDYGPGYKLNSLACGGARGGSRAPAPRSLRGLTRDLLAPFLKTEAQ